MQIGENRFVYFQQPGDAPNPSSEPKNREPDRENIETLKMFQAMGLPISEEQEKMLNAAREKATKLGEKAQANLAKLDWRDPDLRIMQDEINERIATTEKLLKRIDPQFTLDDLAEVLGVTPLSEHDVNLPMVKDPKQREVAKAEALENAMKRQLITAVVDAQKKLGVNVDGMFGPKTMLALLNYKQKERKEGEPLDMLAKANIKLRIGSLFGAKKTADKLRNRLIAMTKPAKAPEAPVVAEVQITPGQEIRGEIYRRLPTQGGSWEQVADYLYERFGVTTKDFKSISTVGQTDHQIVDNLMSLAAFVQLEKKKETAEAVAEITPEQETLAAKTPEERIRNILTRRESAKTPIERMKLTAKAMKIATQELGLTDEEIGKAVTEIPDDAPNPDELFTQKITALVETKKRELLAAKSYGEMRRDIEQLLLSSPGKGWNWGKVLGYIKPFGFSLSDLDPLKAETKGKTPLEAAEIITDIAIAERLQKPEPMEVIGEKRKGDDRIAERP